MDTFSLIAIAVLVLATLWWVLNPLWQRADRPAEQPIEPLYDLAELETRRDILYRAIKDLELDFEAGKIAESDYQQVRLKFMQQAAEVLKQMDRLSRQTETGLEAEIDAMLARFQAEEDDRARALRREARAEILRQAALSPAEAAAEAAPCPACGAPVAAGDAFCSQCGAALGNRCPACDAPVAPEDRFCTHCGARLTAEVAS
ncbi:MAG: zinc ribbon domain-containing protein [Caldilineae bacterium]|nr:MAG: zinc ribbon domain-containing protein [Caldilineae bacterium]